MIEDEILKLRDYGKCPTNMKGRYFGYQIQDFRSQVREIFKFALESLKKSRKVIHAILDNYGLENLKKLGKAIQAIMDSYGAQLYLCV